MAIVGNLQFFADGVCSKGHIINYGRGDRHASGVITKFHRPFIGGNTKFKVSKMGEGDHKIYFERGSNQGPIKSNIGEFCLKIETASSLIKSTLIEMYCEEVFE